MPKFDPTEGMTREQFEQRYPAGNYDRFVATNQKLIDIFENTTAEMANAGFVSAADENRKAGHSND